MFDDLPLFDLAESLRRRDEGVTVASENNATPLIEAREIARDIAKRLQIVNADMVQKVMYERHGRDVLGNAAGGIFRGRDWEFIGYTRATRIQSHGNTIRNWRYIGQ